MGDDRDSPTAHRGEVIGTVSHCHRSDSNHSLASSRWLLQNREMANEFLGTRLRRAVDPALNIAREYSLRATVDLFGRIVVEQRWGRIGREGCGRTISFDNAAAAERYIERVAARRATAPQRLNVSYIEVGKPRAAMRLVTVFATLSRHRKR